MNFRRVLFFLQTQQIRNSDHKTMEDLFYLMNDSLPDAKFIDALVYWIDQLKISWQKPLSILWHYYPNSFKLPLKANTTNIEALKPDTAIIA